LTSDKGIRIIEAFQYCFNKYWSGEQTVKILGYKEPSFKLKDNFEFISLGVDRGPNYIGGDLIKFFKTVNDQEFIFSVDDFLLIREVNISLLNVLSIKFIKGGFSRLALTDQVSNKPHTVIGTLPYCKIIEMGQGAEYRKSAVWSMWSKDYFLKYFNDKMNLWEWELDTTCKDDGRHIMGTNDSYILQACHLYKQGNLKEDWYKDSESSDTMFEEDRTIVANILSL